MTAAQYSRAPLLRVLDALNVVHVDTSPAGIRAAVDQALQPEEPDVPGTLVVTYVAGGSLGQLTEVRVFQLIAFDDSRDDDNALGPDQSPWWDTKFSAWRSWQQICDLGFAMRIYTPGGDL